MTVTMIEGFDTYNGAQSNIGLASRWVYGTFNNNGAATSLVPGRFGGQALRLAEPASGPAAAGWYRTFGAPTNTVGFGFAYRSSNVLGHSQAFVPLIAALFDGVGGTWHLQLGVAVDGSIKVYRATGSTSGTLLATSAAGVIRSNTFHFIEAEMVVHDTAGRVAVKVDGMTVLSASNVDTRNGGTGVVDSIVLAANSGDFVTSNHDFDDLYVTDTGQSLGERRVDLIIPNADVEKAFVPSSGTTNYTQVDEAPVTGDTDFVSGSLVGDADTYGFTDLTSLPVAVDAVQLVAYAKKTDAGTRGLALQVKNGAATSEGPTTNLNASYAKIERLMNSHPVTGLPWTYATVNALTAGPKVTV